jgi:predicted nucleic acid-binding protein
VMRPLAIFDTSALIYLLTQRADDSPEELETDRKRTLVVDRIAEMQKKYRWAIPSVVVAELGRDGSADAEVQRLTRSLGTFRVLGFHYRAAMLAARIAAKALKSRAPGTERGAVKYDALITATAIAYGADCIVTENARDFRNHLAEAGSDIEVIIPSGLPATGQLHLLHGKKP